LEGKNFDVTMDWTCGSTSGIKKCIKNMVRKVVENGYLRDRETGGKIKLGILGKYVVRILG
jgi:hypothetical protein